MTRDKLFGKYEHNLLVHAPLQYRLVSGESSNVEDEERVFNTIRNCSHGTTNNWPGHLIGNLFVRLQVETQCKEKYSVKSDNVHYTLNEIHNVGLEVHAEERNSLFTYDYIQKNVHDWQCHLERISDFLVFGEVWWKKTEIGIEFFDHIDEPNDIVFQPRMHHFRSSSFTCISKELQDHWNFIINSKICIPSHVILEGNDDEMVNYIPTPFLEDMLSTNTSYPQRVTHAVIDGDDECEEDDEEILDLNLVSFEPIIDCVESPHESGIVTPTDMMSHHNDLGEGSSSSFISGQNPVELNTFSSSVNSVAQNLNTAVSCSSSNPTTGSYFTREGYAIGVVLGQSSLLSKYDHTKSEFKLKNNSDAFLKDLLIDLQSQLQILVLKKVSSLKQDLKEWERSFMVENDFSVPSQNDYGSNSYITGIKRKIRTGVQLLDKWNIHF